MKLLKYIFILNLFIISATAQEVITLEKAVNLALNKNLSIKISKKNYEISQNNIHPGNAGLLPRLDLTADVNYTDAETTSSVGTIAQQSTLTNAGINASYTLFNGLSNIKSYTRLQKLGNVGEIQHKLTTENVILSVIQSYHSMALANENMNIAKQALEISENRYNRVVNQNKYGSANKIEVLNAKVDLSSDSISYYNSKLAYINSRQNLNVLLNLEQGYEYTVESKVSFIPEMLYEDLLNDTRKGNSELLLAKEEIKIADLDKQIAGAGYMPTLDLSANYGYNQRGNDFNVALDDPNYSFGAKLSLKYNLFNGMQTSIKNQNAAIAVENKKTSLADTKNKVERDLAIAFNSYQNNLFIMDVQERNLETAKANFKRTEELYKLGQATTIRFREAQLNLIKSKNNLASARYNAKNAEVKVLKIAGKLIK